MSLQELAGLSIVPIVTEGAAVGMGDVKFTLCTDMGDCNVESVVVRIFSTVGVETEDVGFTFCTDVGDGNVESVVARIVSMVVVIVVTFWLGTEVGDWDAVSK